MTAATGDLPSDPPGLDLTRLRSYLDRALPGLVSGPLTGAVIAGGKSNLTYQVTDGVRRLVVRRPPLGHVLATAHDMSREHRVMTALRPTAVPVPATLALCADAEVLGAPFYVMEYVEGVPLRTRAELAGRDPRRVRRIAAALIDVLGELHAVDPDSVGLGDFGRPEGFLARQVRRWKRQLDASRSRDLPGIDALHDRLAAAIPTSSAPVIVHGDYRLDNVLVDEQDRIRAVLDWEMATLGDPLVDLGLMVVYRDQAAVVGAAVAPATAAEGFPAAPELIAMYAERTGRDVSRLDWYLAFACFKLAVIVEGIHYRFAQGLTVGDDFDRIGELVAPLVAHAHDVLRNG